MEISPLQQLRHGYKPKLPKILSEDITTIAAVFGEKTAPKRDQDLIRALFPHTYGKSRVSFAKGPNPAIGEKRNVAVILSGGQAPGGHNVISGIFDAQIGRAHV